MNEVTSSFVIRAPQEMHDQVHAVLESIRFRNEPVEIQSVILEAIDAAVFQQVGIAVSDQESLEHAKIISEEDLDRLKRIVEAGGGKASYVPKLTTNLGSITEVKCPIPDNDKRQAMLQLYVRAVPTADRKSIRLNVATNSDRLATELSRREQRVDDQKILLLDTSQKVKPGSFDKPKGRVLVAIRARLKEEVESK